MDHAGDDANPNQFAIQEISVNPREDVEEAIGTKGKKIMRGESVVALSVLEEEDLREDGDGLKVLTKCPEDCSNFVEGLAVEEESEDDAWDDEITEAEGVVVFVMCSSPRVLVTHEVANEVRGAEEEEFHCSVVERDINDEEIKVTSGEDDSIQELGPERDTSGRLLTNHFTKKDNDSCKVQHICNETEEIHFFFFF